MAMDKDKVFKGYISNWGMYTVDFTVLNKSEREILCKALPDLCHESEGSYIVGTQDGEWIRTSYIVRKDGDDIETINSRYTLRNKWASKEESESGNE